MPTLQANDTWTLELLENLKLHRELRCAVHSCQHFLDEVTNQITNFSVLSDKNVLFI